MATEDLFAGVNFNDGGEVDYGDHNDAQTLLVSRLFDQVIERLIGGPTDKDPEFISQQGANASTAWAYALSVGGGNPRQGSTNNKVQIGAGTLLQKISNTTGAEAKLLPYTFAGTDEVAIANGDPTNPRIDMIQMALAWVTDDPVSRDFQDAVTGANTTTTQSIRRRVQCTLSVKQGAPAASPSYPAPDAGNVPIACVVVPANYSGAAPFVYRDDATNAVIHDLRMPIAIKPHTTRPQDFAINTADGSWTLSTGGTRWQAVGTGEMYVPCMPRFGRLIAVDVAAMSAPTTAGSHKLVEYNLDGGNADRADVSSFMNGTAAFVEDQVKMTDWEAHELFSAGPTIAGNGTHSPPIWCNGARAPYERHSLGTAPRFPTWLALRVAGAVAGEQVYAVTFYVAEGL